MRSRWDQALLWGGVGALVLHRATRFTERDPYWQARDGLERWHGTALSRPDSWSWAQPEGLFRPTSPAWNTALAFGHESLGLGGIAAIGALGMLAYVAVAVVVSRRLGAEALPTLAATAIVAALALPMISPRATIVVEALLLAVCALGHMLIIRDLPRTWPTYVAGAAAGATLGWAGAWLHVSWSVTALGLAFALPLLAVLAGAARWRLRLAALSGVALAIGSQLGPYRWAVWDLLLDVSTASEGQVLEWLSPLTAGVWARWLPVAVVGLILAGACALRLWRHRGGAAGSPERARWALEVVLVATSLAAGLAGLAAIRFLGVAALTLLPVLAAELPIATERWRARPGLSPALRARLTAGYWRPILTGALVILLPLAIATTTRPGRPEPEAELVPSLPRECRLFADPDAAGAVLLLRRDVPVWIDLRTEVHGSAAYTDIRRRLADPLVADLPAGATCALVPSSVDSVTVDGHPTATWQRITSQGTLALWSPT